MASTTDNLWLTLNSLIQNFKEMKNYICKNCNALEDIRFFPKCGHAGCVKCTDGKIKCLQCERVLEKMELNKFENLDEIVLNIKALHNINIEGYKPTRVITFFSPESTLSKRDPRGETRLHKDCREGKLDKVETLLKTGADVNIQDFAGWTALHEAVMAQNVEVVKLLLDYGAFVNIPGLNYVTPLHIAVQKNNISLIKLLVEYGADLLKFDKDGKTPMDYCDKSNDLKAVLCLTPRHPIIYKIYSIPSAKVYYLNISNEDIQALANAVNITVSTESNLLNIGDITYLVIGHDNELNVKHLQAALLQGACVVNKTWINDYTAKKAILNPFDYIANLPDYAVHKAFANKLDKLPRLFDGLRFYFCTAHSHHIDGLKYTLEDLRNLVNLGGGKVLTRRPNRLQDHDFYYAYHSNQTKITYYLIYDENQPNHKEHILMGTKYKSSKWLLKCINSFSIII